MWQPRRAVMRSILAGMIRVLFRSLTRFKIVGQDNVPSGGPLLVVANHFHFADPLAVIRVLPWHLDFVGGFHMRFAPPWIRWIPRMWGLHRVRRHGSSRSALRAAESTLRQGGVLGIFPEGGSWANVLRPPRPGSAFLAARTGVRILPIGIDGMEEIFPCLGRFRRAAVTIRIGKPIGPFDPAASGRSGREELDHIGETIMRAIAALLPASKQGVYSDDPELRAAAEKVAAYPWARQSGGGQAA